MSWIPGAPIDDAEVLGLHQLDTPPITMIEFLPELRAFRITMPDDQPSGVYTGVIVSRGTGRALGTMIATVYGD